MMFDGMEIGCTRYTDVDNELCYGNYEVRCQPNVKSLSPNRNTNSLGLGNFQRATASFEPTTSCSADVFDDFKNNGVEAELDELDRYQIRLRENSHVNTKQPAMVSVQNNKILEYMLQRERKKAKSFPIVNGGKKVCVFCKNNKEHKSLFSSHLLKDETGRVTCPILRNYTCPLCRASKDRAHTIKYCPLNNGVLTSALSTGETAGTFAVGNGHPCP